MRDGGSETTWSAHLDRYWQGAGTVLNETRVAWPALSAYERFEQIVTLVLTVLISLVIVAALANLTFRIVLLLIFGLVDPAEQAVFQAIFGMIMTVLIALEFNHSVLSVLARQHGVIQVRTVVLIALLALVRKFIIIDATKVDPVTLIGLAAATGTAADAEQRRSSILMNSQGAQRSIGSIWTGSRKDGTCHQGTASPHLA